MTSLERIRYLNIVLTSQCNLRCSYCYQNAKKKRSMPWETLRTSLDLALDSRQRTVGILFLGGEPLLEFLMMSRAVQYAEKNRHAGVHLKYGISTNGTLITDEMAAFLEKYRFDLQLSFDGVAGAQDVRGPGTFTPLDALLDRLRGQLPLLHKSIRIAITITPATVDHLPASIDYFLKKGIQKIGITPSFVSDSDWGVERIDDLDSLFGRVYESSLHHWQRTGKTPVLVFRDKYEDSPCVREGRPMCGIVHGETLTVDVDGHGYGCTTLAGSYQKFESPLLRSRLDPMRMKSIHDPMFAERHASFPEAARRAELFHCKENKYSSYGRCGECKHFALCSLCPASIGHVPGNSDPNRVSDFCCAYYMVSLKYRERFPSQRRPADIIRIPDDLSLEMERWRSLAEAMREARQA